MKPVRVGTVVRIIVETTVIGRRQGKKTQQTTASHRVSKLVYNFNDDLGAPLPKKYSLFVSGGA